MKNKNKIWLSPPHMSGEEISYVNQAFDTNWIAPLGPNVIGFEKDISKLTNAKHVKVLSSGTAAIHLALIMLNVKPNDEVICSSFTFSASANPICYLNAKPIFVDSENETWNMCPNLLEQAIIDRIQKNKKPKAIILVHLYGMPSKMTEIIKISKKYSIPVIEDAAESLGAKYNDKYLGTFGKMGIFSFNGNKIITTSGGGALVTKDKKMSEKALFLSTQSRDKAPHYQHSHIGYNYRMSNVLAGIGRGQIRVLNDRVKARRRIFNYYFKHLSQYSFISFQDELEGFYSNRWLSCIITKSFNMREMIRKKLEFNNIEARPLWKPMHKQPIFKKYPYYGNGVSDDIFNRGLCLPSGSNLSNHDLKRIVKIIKDTIN